jgi:acyl-CoA reductase-like NAD-dependent aldehyde dehydrogenase
MLVVDPATGATLADVAEPDGPAVASAYRRARSAQPAWAAAPLADRAAAIRRFRALVVERTEALARTLTREVGKPIVQARRELAGVLGRIDFFLDHVAAAVAGEAVLADGTMEERITREPLGVVANVSAWNYPWFVGANVFLPALLTGNAVLYKPSELATLTGLAIAELLHEAGVPADVFQAVVGGGSVGERVVMEPVDAVCFTGSLATGRKVAAAVAPRLVKLQLELGGKDPAYVCDDVDPGAAAAAVAEGAFYNAGQSCCAVERVYVHERVARPFVEAFVATVKGYVVGDPLDERTDLGPLTRRDAALTLLAEQVADATARRARVLTGGTHLDRPGWFFAPTVLADVDHGMRVMREETFGPLIGIAVVASDDEAVERMNDTDYGLTAAVYGRDRARAERLLARLDVGTAYWNCCDRVSPALPWTGRRGSGLGVTLSREGIAAFLRPKAWHLRGEGPAPVTAGERRPRPARGRRGTRRPPPRRGSRPRPRRAPGTRRRRRRS